MKLSHIVSGLLTATIVLTMSGCASQTDSTISDQVAGKEESSVTQVPAPSEQVTNQDTNRVFAVQAGSQPAWSNEGNQSEVLLVTLRSSQALMKEGESAMLKASANNVSGKPMSVNMFLQLGNGLILSSATSCTGDPCTGQFDIPDGRQALMNVLVQSSGRVAQSYSVVLHYNYTDPETGNKVQGKVEGLIGSTEHVVSRVPSANIEAPQGIKLVPGPTPAPTSHSNLATAPTYTPEATYPPSPTYTPVTIPTATPGLPTPYPTSTPRPTYTPVPTPTPPPSKILFASRSDPDSGKPLDNTIYVMNADGSGLTMLTSNGDYDPAWSLDGKKIAFSSTRNGSHDIYVMNSDGSGQTRLTNDPAHDGNPTWSPDGRRIAFHSDRHGGINWKIYVMNADGSGQTTLTKLFFGWPAWSPDGTRIAYGGYTGISVMNADGSGQTTLIDTGFSRYSAWSADSTKIAFYWQRDGEPGSALSVMNADGSGQTSLTDSNLINISGSPTWSPDGTKIAFECTETGFPIHEICVINADGSGQITLTNIGAHTHNDAPAWSPFIR